MSITSATQAVLTLETLPDMPATGLIAKSLCPNTNQAAKTAILTAYEFYEHGLHNDNVIAGILLYKPSLTSIINPAAFKIDQEIIDTVDFLQAQDPEIKQAAMKILELHKVPALVYTGITYQNAVYYNTMPDNVDLRIIRNIVAEWSIKRPEYANCLQFAHDKILNVLNPK